MDQEKVIQELAEFKHLGKIVGLEAARALIENVKRESTNCAVCKSPEVALISFLKATEVFLKNLAKLNPSVDWPRFFLYGLCNQCATDPNTLNHVEFTILELAKERVESQFH